MSYRSFPLAYPDGGRMSVLFEPGEGDTTAHLTLWGTHPDSDGLGAACGGMDRTQLEAWIAELQSVVAAMAGEVQ